MVEGIDTAYAAFGSADSHLPVVLALHGWGASADLIAPLGVRLASAGFRVIAPDLPGFGETLSPASAWSVHDYAKHVNAFAAALGIESFCLFGHSFGGRLALILGATQPAQIRAIALANSAGVPPRRSPHTQLRLHIYRAFRDGLKAIGQQQLSEHLRAWYVNRYGSADYRSAGVLRDSFVRIINEDLLPYAARIKTPTLLIWGAKDEDTPLWQGQKLHETIPNSGLIVYDDAGHYSYLDRLDAVARTLDYFYRHPDGTSA